MLQRFHASALGAALLYLSSSRREPSVARAGATSRSQTSCVPVQLGGKGANLAEMCRIGLRVPPGMTISTATCKVFHEEGARRKQPALLSLAAQLRHQKPLLASARALWPLAPWC